MSFDLKQEGPKANEGLGYAILESGSGVARARLRFDIIAEMGYNATPRVFVVADFTPFAIFLRELENLVVLACLISSVEACG